MHSQNDNVMLYRTLTFTPVFQLPWIAEFVVDCGWCADVVNILNEIDRGQVNPSVLAAHEDLLCCVAKVITLLLRLPVFHRSSISIYVIL